MQYNSHANKIDIVSDIDFWAKTNSTTYPIADKTRNVNVGLDRVWYLIMKSDGRWKWDDPNNTDMPVGRANLVSGQQDYGISTVHQKIIGVSVRESNGNVKKLNLINLAELGVDPAEYRKTAGTPEDFELRANSVFVYPKPSYSYTKGLIIYFQRNGSYFATTDTTKVAGFNPQFHRLLSLYAARDYCASNPGHERKLLIINGEITKLEVALMDFYSSRADDIERTSMSVKKEDYGAKDLA